MDECTFPDCKRPRWAGGLCNSHYAQRQRGRDLRSISERLPDDERFWRRVNRDPGHGPEGTCWLWTGRTSRYGVTRLHGRRTPAHRAAYLLTYGAIPDGMQVLHSCDNPPCCNPAHLSIGTHADNMRDMVNKRRHRAHFDPTFGVRGEAQGAAKLTDAKVIEIRARAVQGEPRESIARTFGVSRRLIGMVLAGEIWRHVPSEPDAAAGFPA